MKIMMLIHSDERAESGAPPDPRLLAAMTGYNDALTKAGVLLTCDGLHPSSQGFRLHSRGGEITVIDGPFGAPRDLIAGYWMLDVKTKEEAVAWARRVPIDPASASRIELRPLMEMADFPVQDDESGWREQETDLRGGDPNGPLRAPVPPADGGRKLRYLLMFKADAHSEAGGLPNQRQLTEMGDLMAEMVSNGMLLAGEGLRPSAHATRLRFDRGKPTVIDGPFAETKEMIAGFIMMQASSREEALDWATRGMRIHGDGEAEVRRVFDPEDLAAGPEFRQRAAG